jgi:hypothetical protein
MAATFAFRASQSGRFHPDAIPGAFDEALVEVTGDTSYPAGGYAFGTAQLQNLSGGAFSTIESIEVVNPWFNSGGPSTYIAAWNKSTGKLQAFAQGTAGAAIAQIEVTAATNLAAFTCTVRVRFN